MTSIPGSKELGIFAFWGFQSRAIYALRPQTEIIIPLKYKKVRFCENRI